MKIKSTQRSFFLKQPATSNSVNDVKVEKAKRVRLVKKKEEPVVILDAKSSDENEVVENIKEDRWKWSCWK